MRNSWEIREEGESRDSAGAGPLLCPHGNPYARATFSTPGGDPWDNCPVCRAEHEQLLASQATEDDKKASKAKVFFRSQPLLKDHPDFLNLRVLDYPDGVIPAPEYAKGHPEARYNGAAVMHNPSDTGGYVRLE